MSNAKVPEAIRAREIFDNNGSTLLGVRRFRGWGLLSEQWRPRVDELDGGEIVYWIYSYDTPIAWVYETYASDYDCDEIYEPVMPQVRYSKATLHHQKIAAEALGLKVNPIDWPLAHPLAGAR